MEIQPGPLRTVRHWVRAVGNALNLSTPAGLLVAVLGGAQLHRGPDGLVFADGYRWRFPLAGAFTVGNVIIARQPWHLLNQAYPSLADHEERHTWQYLYCGGLLYYPAYVTCMGWSILRTGDRASANYFERQAGLAAGGYQAQPRRPVGPAVAAQLSILRSMPRRFAERLR